MGPDVIALEPDAFARERGALASAAPGLALSPSEALLLKPDHPFLRFGSWCAFVATRDGRPAARLVASVDPRQCATGAPVGAIGFIAERGDVVALRAAMAAAQAWLRDMGASVIRCPVQLSTWFGHRAMVDGFPVEGGAAPFALEPHNARALVDVLQQAAFAPAHRAVSQAVCGERAVADGRRCLERLRSAGVRDRPVDLDKLPGELALLHSLAARIFRDHWAFSEISLAEFAAFYQPNAGLVDAQLVRIIEDGAGEALGFVLAIPDASPPETTEPSADTGRLGGRFVVKSIGLLPAARRRYPGIGAAVASRVHSLALSRGYRQGIHALMAEHSNAHRISSRWGTWLRSYATFERIL